jgi:indolepyruvate ferredoxin oxidoreductase
MQSNLPQLKDVSLSDKYELRSGRAYMTGIEALVRLLILQRQRDEARGVNTAGFVSGYRGSPLGGLDQTLWKAQKYLDQHQVRFQPGVNEDLAMTAVRGTQEVTMFPGALHEGVFGMWYGKGPGLDRSMDALKHANAVGTSQFGGVLAVAGDDHGCKSSSLPHQSEHDFISAMVPILAPANVQEILDYGVLGWELSRFSGCWVGFKLSTEVCDSAASVDINAERVQVCRPENVDLPPDGVHARWPDSPLDQERRLNRHKIYAAREFARANGINRIVKDSSKPCFGIITTGKAYLDVLQALDDLGIDETQVEALGIRIFKVGMPWPLEPIATHDFAEGLDEILVVEEKRSIIEDQLTGQLYNMPVEQRPRVIGEFDEDGKVLLGNLGEVTPAMIARVIASRISRYAQSNEMKQRLEFLAFKEKALEETTETIARTPYYCSGCPHNTSTVVPEGSRAMGGIGCHYMAQWMDRDTETFTQMGAEGTTWIGQAPFTSNKHVFQNLGDGTYFHSGSLAIRATIAANVNITYKILYNDAVGMTGGQPIDGVLTVADIVRQVHAEGVRRVAVVSDEPDKYPENFLPPVKGLTVHHRDDLDAVQRELREVVGTSILIYDQTCAAEKRRRRKKGQFPNPQKRVVINEAVCEGCGDCSVQSNCLSVLPKETEFGRKRSIDQASCNKDFSCVKGFCPSFVTVEGTDLRPAETAVATGSLPPEPDLPSLQRPWNIVLTGIGGTGVVTVSAILGMAAHLEGKGCSVFNLSGMAQKFGPVMSHVRIGLQQEDIDTPRVAAGDADLLMGCDLVVSASDDALGKVSVGRSHAVINDYEAPTAGFVQNRDMTFPADAMKARIARESGEERTHFVDATRLAGELMGDPIAANMFLMGYVWQKGLIPITHAAIDRAIELNNVAVRFNRDAFEWGRRMAHDPVGNASRSPEEMGFKPETAALSALIDRRAQFLVDYQNDAYARRYREFVESVCAREEAGFGNKREMAFSRSVAEGLFRLMAYKDEYEVARLYTSGDFTRHLEQQFAGKPRLTFHLAPPLISRRDPHTGHLKKREFGPWIMPAFKLIARLKGLRGSRWDIFGLTAERRMERQLIEDYRALIESLLPDIHDGNYDAALALAKLPQDMRGFGHVKEKNVEVAQQRQQTLLAQFRGENDVTPEPLRFVEAAG